MVKDECECGKVVYYHESGSSTIPVVYDDEEATIEHECEEEDE